MAFDPQFREYIEERLAFVPSFRSRPMFGCVAFYAEDKVFGILADGKLWLKVGILNQADYESAGMQPFFPFDSPKPMGYWELPPGVLENEPELRVWADKAIAVALASPAPKRKRKP